MKNGKLLVSLSTALLASSVISGAGFAQTVPSTIQPPILRSQDKEAHPKAEMEAVQTPAVQPPALQPIGASSFVLSAVDVTGSTKYSPAALSAVYGSYIGKTVSVSDLQSIANSITAMYRKDGYVLSSAVVSPQEIVGGRAVINVNEGYVSNIIYQGGISHRKGLIEGFGQNILNDKPLSARTLERYLLLINDLPGMKARGFLRPSQVEQGASELVIAMEHKFEEYAVEANNRGSRLLGRYQFSGVAAYNSPMEVYDRITVRGITTGPDDEFHYLDVIDEQQIGSEGTKIETRATYAHAQPGSRIKPLHVEGKVLEVEAKVKHPLIRSRSKNMELRGGLDYFESDYDLSSLALYNDSVRVVTAGAEFDTTDSFGGVTQIDGDVRQGIDGLGATDKGLGRSNPLAEPDFTSIRANITRLQHIYKGLSMFSGVAGQYAFDPLLASEQFTLGGGNYGKAYDPAEISGDHGVAFKTELRYRIQPENSYLHEYEPYVFYDIGKVWRKDLAAGVDDSDSLASLGAGIRANFTHNYTGYAEVNLPLTREIAAEGSDGEEARAFFSLNKRF